MDPLGRMLDVCRHGNRGGPHPPSGGKEPHWLILTVCKVMIKLS